MSESLQSDTRAAVSAGRRASKSASAFRTISEVARELDVPQHVLRFWESRFTQVKPLKRGGGRRYYRPEDIELLRSIRALLYRDGYTIKGAQKLMREGSILRDDEIAGTTAPVAPAGNGKAHDEAAASVAVPETVAMGLDAMAAGLSPGQRAEIKAVIDELADIRKLLQG